MNCVDTHAHIFERGLPLAPKRRYAPTYDATVEDYLRNLDSRGVSVGMLVQPSFLGTDNSYMISALRRYPERLRGVAVVVPEVSREEIEEMDRAGVRGIRLNLDGLPIPDLRADAWPGLLALLRRMGWHVELHRAARDLPAVIDPLLKSEVRVVVDHFGRPDPAAPLDDPGFQYLLSVGSSGLVWVKLAAAYRLGGAEAGEKAALLTTPRLLDRFGPDRLVWGSDWPHTRNETIADFSGTFDALKRWVPDDETRRKILETAPAALFTRP